MHGTVPEASCDVLSTSPSSVASSASIFQLELSTEGPKQHSTRDAAEPTSVPPEAPASRLVTQPGAGAAPDFNPEKYLIWHKRALLQRARVGHGRSHEMLRLYHFWVSFLQDGFNEPMYTSFKRYAEEDASAGHTYGLSCLFSFYLKYLTAEFDAELYSDFEALALKYQDYLDFQEGLECLAQLLAGPPVPSSGQGGAPTPPLPSGQQGAGSGGSSKPPSRPASSTGFAAPAAGPAPVGGEGAGPQELPVSGGADTKPVAPTTPHTAPLIEAGGVAQPPAVTSRLPPPPGFVPPTAPAGAAGDGPPSFPGLPKSARVTVDPRVVEFMATWQACRRVAHPGMGGWGAHWHPHQHASRGGEDGDAATLGSSLTGSSDPGDPPSLPLHVGASYRQPRHAYHQGGRGRRVSAGSSPPPLGHSHSVGASPPSALLGLAGVSPAHPALLHGFNDSGPAVLRVGSAPGAGLPTSARIKRSRARGAGPGKRNSAGLGGASPPLGSSPASWANSGVGGHGPPHAGRGPGRGGSATASPHPPPHASKGRGARVGVDRRAGSGAAGAASGEKAPRPGASSAPPGQGEHRAPSPPPLWEAQPCGVTCGSSAELVRALPLRLGELFGD